MLFNNIENFAHERIFAECDISCATDEDDGRTRYLAGCETFRVVVGLVVIAILTLEDPRDPFQLSLKGWTAVDAIVSTAYEKVYCFSIRVHITHFSASMILVS